MTLSFRSLVITLLVAMAAFGHAPVWLHVASCEHDERGRAESSVASDCHQGCCQHLPASDVEAGGELASRESSHREGDHDSDSCSLCQALGVPIGVAWESETLPNERLTLGAWIPFSVSAPESSPLTIPQPRGPPAFGV